MMKIIRGRNKRRGQMFILATMLMAVYIVTMSATILNINTLQSYTNDTIIREPHSNIKREIQSYLELLLAYYTQNTSSFNRTTAELDLSAFLNSLKTVYSARSVLTEIELLPNSFSINANMVPNENVQIGSVYSSAIQAGFHIKLTDLSFSINLIEDFNVSFVGRVEVIGTTLAIQQIRSNIAEYVDASSIFVLNGSLPLIPSPNINRTGYYYFDNTLFNNIGILSVTLPNGVRVYS